MSATEYRLRPWPQGDYLIKMADHKPTQVADILCSLDVNGNNIAGRKLLEATLRLPSSEAKRLVPKICLQLDEPRSFDPRQLVALLRLLASDPTAKKKFRRLVSTMFTPPGRLEEYWYRDCLPAATEAMYQLLGLEALQLLSGWLKDLARSEGDWVSHVWRPSVGAHSQNRDRGIGSAWVEAARDLALRAVHDHPASLPEVVDRLEKPGSSVSGRIVMHTLAEAVKTDVAAARQLAEQRFLNPDFLEPTFRHEYAELGRAVLDGCSEEVARQWFDMVHNRPEPNDAEIRDWIAASARGRPDEVSDEEVDLWRKRRLWRLLLAVEEQLPAILRAQLDDLDSELGPRPKEPSDFVSWSTSFVGPVSPATRGDLEAMPPEALIGYLAEWEPPAEQFFGPSREGLGRELTEMVKGRPSLFDGLSDRLVDLHPTYLRSALSGWDAALREGGEVPWSTVLGVVDWVSRKPDEGDGAPFNDEDPGWRWAHQEAARLLRTGLGSRTAPRPTPTHRDTILTALQRLCTSPDPTPEREGREETDSLTLSLNSVRSTAIAATVSYLAWLVETAQVEPGGAPADTAPEVWSILDEHLASDPSRAVRSVYGQELPFLAFVSPAWAEGCACAFTAPGEPGSHAATLADAAWAGFVFMRPPSKPMLDLLEQVYLERLRNWDTPTDGRHGGQSVLGQTAQHVIVLYAHGMVELNGALIEAAFDQADVADRAQLLGRTAWLYLRRDEPVGEEIVERIQALWDWRWAAVQAGGDPQEVSHFGWWLHNATVPAERSMPRLAQVAATGVLLEPPMQIIEDVVPHAKTFPGECLTVLEAMLDHPDQWEADTAAGHAAPILAAALDSGDELLARRAEATAELLGRRGYVNIRSEVAGARSDP